MKGLVHRTVRDLHLFLGLFVSPFVLVYAISVFFLVHAWLPKSVHLPGGPHVVSGVPLPANLEQLSGSARIDALKPTLAYAGVHGEVGWVSHNVRDNHLVIPVTVPGRLTTVTIDVAARQASVEDSDTGLADALVVLHRSPGPHLVGMRMNWFPMRVWFWLADSTVYLILFLTVSGVFLWYALRADRKVGCCLLATGAISFLCLVYGLVH